MLTISELNRHLNMAKCVNESDLLPNNLINQSLSSEDSTFYDSFSRIINSYALPAVCVFGVFGNILNLTILTRRKLQKSFRSLEQAANLCLIALAVSDLMFCVLAFLYTFLTPNVAYSGKGVMYFYQMYSTAFINLFIMESTMLTVAMSLERYMAICFPLRQDLYLTTRRIKYIIVGSFIFSLAFNVPVLWRYKAFPVCPDNTTMNISNPVIDPEGRWTLDYNVSLGTLISAHFKEDENPLSSKNKSFLSSSPLSLSTSYLSESSTSENKINSISSSSSSSSVSPMSLLHSLLSTPSPLPPTSPTPSLTSSSSHSRFKIKQVPLWGNQVYELAYRICWALVGNFIPLILLFYFNVCLCRNIYFSYKLRRQFKRQNQAKSSSHILTVTLVVIVAMFFILVAPSEIILLVGTSRNTEIILNFLQSLNFSVNFILYCIISRHFRKTLKYLFLCGCYNIYQVSRDWKKEFETSLM